ncbi:MAG TPA: hypothetical protein VG738_15300 [Chitinophagaceae bacterium]|nr:hypothetical protein [Chitinophagaceae bacterium]
MQIDNNRQPYLIPFSLMVIITVVMTYLSYVNLLETRLLAETTLSPLAYLDIFGWPIITAVEAVLYWIIRYKVKSSLPVWVHLSCMLFAFILLNMVWVILDDTVEKSTINMETAMKALKVRVILFWIAFFIGHVFFITVLIKGFSRTKEEDSAETTIFNEVADIE